MPLCAFSQIDKIGYSKEQVMHSINVQPCKISESGLWYCGNKGDLTFYSIKNNLVHSVLNMWEYPSKNDADIAVRKAIEEEKSRIGSPTMKEGNAYWFVGNYLVCISYGYTNGKHYSCWNVSER